jgi:hypothetical protein
VIFYECINPSGAFFAYVFLEGLFYWLLTRAKGKKDIGHLASQKQGNGIHS